MEEEKVNFKAEKNNYAKNEIIILQGSDVKELYFLNSGSIEIKRCSESIENTSPKEIVNKSRRIAVIEAPTIFGVDNLITENNHDSSYVTLTDSQITKYIIISNDFIGFFKNNPPIALNVLLTMQEEARKRLQNLKKFIDFLGMIDKINDNLMLLYLHLTQTKRDKLYQKFNENGGVFPPVIDPNFLIADNSAILGKNYGDSTYNPLTKFDNEKIDFYRTLLKAKPASLISMLGAEIKIFLYIFEDLSSIINSINGETEKYVNLAEEKLNYFFLENSSAFNLIYSILDKIKKSDIVDANVTKSIVKICRNIDHINKQLCGKEYVEVFPKYDILNSIIPENAPSAETKIESDGKYKKLYKESAKKIIGFSTLTNERKAKIFNNLKKVLEVRVDDPSKETRTIIKSLQDDYYELYMNIFLKTYKTPKDTPPYAKLFLYFSFIDETFVTEKQLEFITNALHFFTTEQNTDYPIITLYDFLILVNKLEEEPSLSEMGEFRKLVKKQFSKNEKPIIDTPVGRIDFEINNMVKNSMRITSDNMRGFIPYLRDSNFKGPLSQILVSPKKIDAFLKKIVALDFSLFYRELTWKIPGKSELIKKEIKPYMILLPNAGSRVQLWQEMSYNIRSTRARFLVPIFFNADLFKSLTFSCGHFRWNLNKALVSNWMDPVDGGLTGAYFDYEQSYKKLMDLSDEAKDKIKEQIKSIKIDRNRFAHDYYEWLNYESQGVPKLNKVLRKIFYRFIPFPKDIRNNVSRLPVYDELDRKYNIITDREFKKLEAKFKKYAEHGKMPKDLQSFLDMMQM